MFGDPSPFVEGPLFEEVFGIPTHPLVVHAAVVFVPLLALGSIVYAVLPGLRGHIRWAVILLAAVGAGSATVAKLSGDAFRRRLVSRGLDSPEFLVKINQHQNYGNATMKAAIILGVVALALAYIAPGRVAGVASAVNRPRGAVGDPGPRAGRYWIRTVLAAAAVGLALVTGYYVFKTGDTGAHIVWSGS